MEKSEYKNLGLMNGWHYSGKGNPAEYDACLAAGHQHKSVGSSTWSCYTHYFCDICKIKYEVDSSG